MLWWIIGYVISGICGGLLMLWFSAQDGPSDGADVPVAIIFTLLGPAGLLFALLVKSSDLRNPFREK